VLIDMRTERLLVRFEDVLRAHEEVGCGWVRVVRDARLVVFAYPDTSLGGRRVDAHAWEVLRAALLQAGVVVAEFRSPGWLFATRGWLVSVPGACGSRAAWEEAVRSEARRAA